MKKYSIELYYQTGSSFGSEDVTETLELEWNDISVAKENLKAIQEHYKMYSDLNNWRIISSKGQDICEKVKDKDWFVGDKREIEGKMQYDTDVCGRCINLKTDEGNTMRMHCFWTGYFEHLYGAKIIITDTSDMEFTT